MVNKFHDQHALRDRARKLDLGISIISCWFIVMLCRQWCRAKDEQFDIEGAETFELPVDEYKFFTKILLIHQFQGQKKTIAKEETASRETGLRIRLLTAYNEDPAAAAAHVMNCEVLF
ncbi:hypothetical protein TIFTF001_008035 [Ficus carica]|uniref:Uncharacterized protein n=1 Tax=Ficus carica TaxID=3494 RepID=A0AA87ZMA7_FICCA|nr:hypothetical protein TIFTF001_008035 [Ficus carica]